MNTKYFIPYEIAVKLKDKGYPQFDINRSLMYGDDYYYDKDGVIANCGYGLRSIYGDDFKGAENDYILAPTYHEVIDWLERRGIYVSVSIDLNFYKCKMEYNSYITSCEGKWSSEEFTTREEALNAAIVKALELI